MSNGKFNWCGLIVCFISSGESKGLELRRNELLVSMWGRRWYIENLNALFVRIC